MHRRLCGHTASTLMRRCINVMCPLVKCKLSFEKKKKKKKKKQTAFKLRFTLHFVINIYNMIKCKRLMFLSFQVSIYMDGVEGLCSNVKPDTKSKRRAFRMTPNSAHTVQFPIIPLSARVYPIKISAVLIKKGTPQADAIEKKLHVVVSKF